MRFCAPLALLLLLFTGCDDTVFPVPARTYPATWFGVQMLCYDQCAQCHPSSVSPIALPDAVQMDIENGDDFYVTPGIPADSMFYRVLTADQRLDTDPPQMPLGRPLPADQIAPVKQWILQGGPLQ